MSLLLCFICDEDLFTSADPTTIRREQAVQRLVNVIKHVFFFNKEVIHPKEDSLIHVTYFKVCPYFLISNFNQFFA